MPNKLSDKGKFRRRAITILAESRHVMTAGEIVMMSEGKSDSKPDVKTASKWLKALVENNYISRKVNQFGQGLYKIVSSDIDEELEIFQ